MGDLIPIVKPAASAETAPEQAKAAFVATARPLHPIAIVGVHGISPIQQYRVPGSARHGDAQLPERERNGERDRT